MLALVTGGSQGIGLEYARSLAARGYDLLLVSNQEEALRTVSAEIAGQYKVTVNYRYQDLAVDDAAEQLLAFCREQGFEVEVLVNNAGVFFFNELINTDMRRIELMLKLHVFTVTKMCRLFGEDMARRGHGYILNMSSMSAWMTMPGINVYNSTKSYILNFSRSMWYELRPYGVSITAICPGAVDTGLYNLAPYWRKVAVKLGISMPPHKLTEKALKAMFKKKKHAVPGAINGPFVFIIKHLPDWFVFAVMKRLSQFQK